jgi:alpha-mannosidase
LVLRCYEGHGQMAQLKLTRNWAIGGMVNLLEEAIEFNIADENTQTVTIAPWKIASFQVSCSASKSPS